MPVVSGGVAAWNGGTITNPVTIDLSGHTDAVPLELIGAPAGNADLLQVRAGGGSFAIEVFQAAGAPGGLGVTSAANDYPVVYLDHEGAAPTADIITVAPGGTARSRFNRSGYFMTLLHAAPADADLATGEIAAWFDQTDGAAKLMLKAKQADGTVKTGSVNVTT